MADTAIDICARALVLIGDQPISSFEDGTTGSLVAANLYPAIVRQLLGTYRWRFATGQVQLGRLTDQPDGEWQAAYALPGDCLEVITLRVGGRVIDFDRFGANLLCNASEADTVILEGVFRVNEDQFPAYFTAYLEQVLASQFALAVAAKTDLSDYLDRKAQRTGMAARNLDAQARTADAIDTGGLIRARRRLGVR
jgi:hypothetical protein